MSRIVLVLSSAVIFAILNWSIYDKELLARNGDLLLVELAPVDPRSVMQGDYMRLDYDMPEVDGYRSTDRSGYVVVLPGPERVAKFVRFHNGDPLLPDERLLRIQSHHGSFRIAQSSFMFQEGQGHLYAAAKYGIFRVNGAGESLLVGLADQWLKPIVPD